MTRRASDVLRGLSSLIATTALLVGVPLGLVALVGWPLPTSIPDGESLSRAVNTGVTDQFIVNALAVIAWLAWAQLALALLIEAVAAARGRPPRELPLAPGLQAAAARLVAGIVMLIAPLQPARAVAAAPAPAVAVVAPVEAVEAVIDLRTPSPMLNVVSHGHTLPSVSAASSRTVTVERHDSYWAIAERELDDGLRWREIQALNVGHMMSDGYVIGAGDEMLRAGWVLDLPADAGAGTEVEADSPVSEPEPLIAEVVVEPGDNLWDISEDHLDE